MVSCGSSLPAECNNEIAGIVCNDTLLAGDLPSKALCYSGYMEVTDNSCREYGYVPGPGIEELDTFMCPNDMYALVPAEATIGTRSFCVMRTEAKNDGNDNPISQYSGVPWTLISAHNAKSTCKALSYDGYVCDLISNPFWMAIARDLERTAAACSSSSSPVLENSYHYCPGATPVSCDDNQPGLYCVGSTAGSLESYKRLCYSRDAKKPSGGSQYLCSVRPCDDDSTGLGRVRPS